MPELRRKGKTSNPLVTILLPFMRYKCTFQPDLGADIVEFKEATPLDFSLLNNI